MVTDNLLKIGEGKLEMSKECCNFARKRNLTI
jgi:hypothetical protein